MLTEAASVTLVQGASDRMRPGPWPGHEMVRSPAAGSDLPLTAACEQFMGVPQRDAVSAISPPTAEHAWFEPSCTMRPKRTFCKADVWSRYSNTKQQVVTKTLIPRISQKTFYKWHENSCTVKKCLIHNFYNVPLHTTHPLQLSVLLCIWSIQRFWNRWSNNRLFKYSSNMKYKINWPYG